MLEYIATLYELEANLKHAKADYDEIRRQRQEKAVPLLGFIKLMLDKYKTVDMPQSALTQACNYALERWDGLCRYCEEGYYEIDKGGTTMLITSGRVPRRRAQHTPADARTQELALR